MLSLPWDDRHYLLFERVGFNVTSQNIGQTEESGDRSPEGLL